MMILVYILAISVGYGGGTLYGFIKYKAVEFPKDKKTSTNDTVKGIEELELIVLKRGFDLGYLKAIKDLLNYHNKGIKLPLRK